MSDKTKNIRCKQIIVSNLLVILTFIGAAVGFGLGIGVRQFSPSESALMWIGILGEMYLNLLKMMIVPLVACSVISGTASLDPKSNGKISIVSLTFIMISNFVPCLVGVLVCLTIKPGEISSTQSTGGSKNTNIQTEDIFADLLRNLFPDNLISATFQKAQTEYQTENQQYNVTINGTTTTLMHSVVISKKVEKSSSTNILGILIASCMLGIAAGAAKETGRHFSRFFYSATEVILLLLGKIIWTTPIGVASLIAKTLASTKNLEEDFNRLGLFIATVMAGLGILSFVALPITYFIFIRRNPFKFLWTMLQPAMIVLASTSTILTTFSSLAIPAVAGASLVTVIILLTALGIPAEEVSLLYAFEWFLDRMRSTTNVFVQGLCGVVTNKICQSSLKVLEKSSENDVAYEKEIVVEETKDIAVSSNIIQDLEIYNHSELFNEKL
ncbi:putative sodium-dependent excitatory amino acid transporter glt-3 isoform X2 [Mytilus galloprovincialis]|uniref:putative sodium-dependent excitatory amino acid transporter glt-3 isoform X2 n=1 Tax=Mytilus galloprovincialis TaxID=29158 RepID=UPI003F7C2C26